MKQLVSLALKYIRRQKFRTVLTFLCVTLAVFIFNLLAGTATVVRGLLIRQQYMMDGKWEVEASPLLDACELNGMNRNDAVQKIMQHAAVDDCFYAGYSQFYMNITPVIPGRYSFLEITDSSGANMQSLGGFSFESHSGNPELVDSFTNPLAVNTKEDALADAAPNSILLPLEYQEKGWKTGDKYTVTITPSVGSIPDDAPQVQKLREKYADKIAENPDARLFMRDLGDNSGDEEDDGGNGFIINKTKLHAVRSEYGADNVEFFDVARGVPYTVTFTVAGFADNAFRTQGSFSAGNIRFQVSARSDIALKKDFYDPNIPFIEENGFAAYSDSAEDYTSLRLTMNRSLPFDDAVELLYKDLGLPENDRDATLHPTDGTSLYNAPLLSLEFRGSDAIATWLTDFETKLPLLLTFLVVAFLVWALMRAVIDNAFEISVQERRSQFATLRIMGASRGHVAALVCLEALFYCLLAVPLGILAAHICAKLVTGQMVKLGIGMEYHAIPALMILTTLLAVAAVFFSAYSSSMWAARAYAPLEATKRSELSSTKKKNIFTKDLFGSDPETRYRKRIEKMKKREQKQYNNLKAPKKAKLSRTPFSYIWNYTMRNIRRTRKRFIISVVTMSFGVLLFSLGITAGTTGKMILNRADAERAENGEELREADFVIDPWNITEDGFYRDIDALTKDNPLFRKVKTVANAYLMIQDEQTVKALTQLGLTFGNSEDGFSDETITDYVHIRVEYVMRSAYEKEIQPLTGISYDDWIKTNRFFALIPDTETLSFVKPENAGPDADTDYQLAQDVSMQLAGVLHGALDGKPRANMLLIPAENMVGCGLSYTQSLTMVIGFVEMWAADAESYPPAKEALTQLASQYENCMLEDRYFAGTGLNSLLRTIAVTCAVVLLAVWLTGIFTMVNTVNTSVLNRADELMMLRTVGMTKRSIRLTVLLESMIFCGIATLIGGTLGLSGTMFFFTVTELNTELSPVGPMLLALALTLAVNLLIAAVAARPGLRTLNARMEAGGMMQ